MEAQPTTTPANDTALDDVVWRGLAIYDDKLKSILEPQYNGKAVAINVDNGEYLIADDLPDVRRLFREKYGTPNGISMTIGPETDEAMLARVMYGRKPMRRDKS